MQTEKLGLGREEKRGSIIYFKEYKIIKRGIYKGYLEVRRGNGRLARIPPEGIIRLPADSEISKKQAELLNQVKDANMALKNPRKR